MKVITLNCNGIRSAARKGFYAWMQMQDADFVCLQETKAQEHQIPPESAAMAHYTAVFLDAEKKGYSGVAVYARKPPARIVRGLNWPDFDREARYLQLDYGMLSVVSLYIPSGSSGPARQEVKEDFLERFFVHLDRLRSDGRSYIVCGDFNVAHRDIDVYDPARCSRISGFFAHERRWIDRVIAELGWVDAFRRVDPAPGRYSWWSNFQGAFERNNGWRIDYQLVTPDVGRAVSAASIYRDTRFSDHAPVTVEYAL
jgi:exodeoxyribonuclease-3